MTAAHVLNDATSFIRVEPGAGDDDLTVTLPAENGRPLRIF